MAKYLMSYDEQDVNDGKVRVDPDGVFRGVQEKEFSFEIRKVNSETGQVELSKSKEDIMAAVDAGKTVYGVYLSSYSANGTVVTQRYRLSLVQIDRGKVFGTTLVFQYRGLEHWARLMLNARPSAPLRFDEYTEVCPRDVDDGMTQPVGMDKNGGLWTFATATDVVLASSTAGSNKKFRLTVNDGGTVSATEVTG